MKTNFKWESLGFLQNARLQVCFYVSEERTKSSCRLGNIDSCGCSGDWEEEVCRQYTKFTRIVVDKGHGIGRRYTTSTEVLGIKDFQRGTQDDKQPQPWRYLSLINIFPPPIHHSCNMKLNKSQWRQKHHVPSNVVTNFSSSSV